MRVLWIGKGASATSPGGEDVYDRKLIQRLERDHDIVRFHPRPVGRAAKLANLAKGVPLYRATYQSSDNFHGVRTAIAQHRPDVVVISWEPLDFLATAIDTPTVLLLHNITSDAVAEVFGNAGAARLYGAYVRRWERRLYGRSNVAGLVTLSARDARIARSVAPGAAVTVIEPGAPPFAPVPAARLLPEVLISGTYDWYPKRRDFTRIARELGALADQPMQIFWDHTPPAGTTDLLRGHRVDVAAWEPALRFGLVPDSFASGFKLKVTYYIANNCIVLTRSEVAEDYADIADHDLFIRRIGGADDVVAAYRDFAGMDAGALAARFTVFRAACAERLSWDVAASRLTTLLTSAAAGAQA